MALRCSRSALTVGLSVPPRIYIEALAKGGIVVTYHLPSATVTQFGSTDADRVAKGLDEKLGQLIESALDRAEHDAYD